MGETEFNLETFRKIVWDYRLLYLTKDELWELGNWKLGVNITKKMSKEQMISRIWEQADRSKLLQCLMEIARQRLEEYEKEGWETEGIRSVLTMLSSFKPLAKKPELPSKSRHDDLVDKIVEIGRMEGMVAERDYKHEMFIYDAVWKKIEKGVPSHVFEVQLRGNLLEALTRLKHAYDLWGSRVILIAEDRDIEKASWLIQGSFHEMRDNAVLLTPEEVDVLFEAESTVNRIMGKIGKTKSFFPR